MQKYFSILTDKGLEKIRNAVANGTKITFSTVAVGDGNGEYTSPYPAQTELVNEMARVIVNYVKVKEPNIIEVSGVIPVEVGGFVIREVGVIDSTGTLIAVANTPDTRKATVNDGAAAELELIIEIIVANSDGVQLKLDPSVIGATKQDVQRVDDRLTAHINDNTLHVTAKEKQAWNSHVNYDDTALKQKVTALETGKADKAVQYQVLIPAVGWSGYAPYTQTVTVEGMTSKGMPVYSHIYTDSQSRDDYAAITSLITNDGSITVTCHEDKPVGNIKILLGVMR